MDSLGNVGISNSSPSYKLDVNGTMRLGKGSTTTGSMVLSNSSNANTLTLNSGATSSSYAVTMPTAQGAASTSLTNDGSGNLSWTSVAGNGGWTTTGNSGTASNTNFVGTSDNISLRFRTNNTERVVMDSLGNVGVNNSSPSYKLDVNGTMRL